MHRLPFADNGNINAGWSAIPHCSRIAMHLKAPPLSRLKKKKREEEDESTPCRVLVLCVIKNSHKNVSFFS